MYDMSIIVCHDEIADGRERVDWLKRDHRTLADKAR